jgi:hypothetical protein
MIPPEVSQAVRRLQGGQGTQADKDLVYQFLINDSTVGGAERATMQAALNATVMPAGLQPGGTSAASPSMGGGPGTDWVVEAKNQGIAPTPPPISGGVDTSTLDVGMPWDIIGDLGASASTTLGDVSDQMPFQPSGGPLRAGQSPTFYSPSSGGMTPPGATPSSVAPAGRALTGNASEDWRQWDPENIGSPIDTSGVISPSGTQLDAKVERIRQQQARQAARGGTGAQDWRSAAQSFGLDPSSAFYGITPAGSDILGKDASLVSRTLYGDNEGMAGLMEPRVQAAMALASTGALSGHGARRGITGGPSSNAGILAQTEGFLNEMGNRSLDPAWAYQEELKRLRNTDEAMFRPEDGDPLAAQINTTKMALLGTAGPFMTDQAAAALSYQIDNAAAEWQMAKAHGDTSTFPQWLRAHGAKRWVQSGF